MSALQVGQPYVHGQTKWREGAGYSYASDGHVLSIFINSPNRRQVEAIRKGRHNFALVIGPDLFFLLYRFGKAMGWSSAPFWDVIVPNEEREVPDANWPEGGVPLRVVLTDGTTGLVRAVRSVALPPHFACELHAAIRRQAIFPCLNKRAYSQALATMRQLCPTPRSLLQRAAACTGQVPREKLVHRVCLREHRLNQVLDLLDRLLRDSYDKEVNIYAQGVMQALDDELLWQGFMRVDGSYDIPRD